MKILMTGAAGRIGSEFFNARQDEHAFLLTDIKPICYDTGHHRVILGDLTDNGFARSIAEDVDAIIHLAGTAEPTSSFNVVMELNVEPTLNLLAAAADQGIKRFIFASSAQTVEGYPLDVQIKADDLVRPANFYGVGKVMGEALCALFAHTRGLETVCLRIGAFEYPDERNLKSMRDLSAWLSPRDAIQLIDASLSTAWSAPLVVNGISNNRFKRLDLRNAQQLLGFEPVDDAFSSFPVFADCWKERDVD